MKIVLFQLYIITALMMASLAANSTNFYVSSSGSDYNVGTSKSKPWQNLKKVNGSKFRAGDSILFKAGDEWEGQLTITNYGTTKHPIVYGSYGSGAKPKIYGSTVITDWILHSGNIYKTKLTNNITQLFIDGERAVFARYPDTGYLTITKVNNTTQFVSTQLANQAPNYYKDATWIGRSSAYSIAGQPVIASDSQKITLSDAPYLGLDINEGFFLVNKLEFLTQAGEWYYDELTNFVYFWLPKSDNPANHEIRASLFDYGISIYHAEYVDIQNLELLHSAVDGILGNHSFHINVNNLAIINPAHNGIFMYNGADYNTVENTFIYEPMSYGIRTYNSNGLIKDNEIIGTGKLKNVGRNLELKGVGLGTGMSVNGNDTEVAYNKIINSGYVGIDLKGTNMQVKYNYINGACQVLDDGGGIYSYNGHNYSDPGIAGSVIRNNIILNVFGNLEGKAANYFEGYGIYMDNAVHDVLIQENTISGASGGLMMNPNGLITVNGNTIMDATLLINIAGQFDVSTLTNNILYTTERTGHYVWWGEGASQKFIRAEKSKPVLDSNTYISHYPNLGSQTLAYTLFPFYGNSLSDWQKASNHDANSYYNWSVFENGETDSLYYNNTKTNKVITLDSYIYNDIYGNQLTDTISLEPFTSKILIKTQTQFQP